MKATMRRAAQDGSVEREGLASQHGETISWDINDVRLPKVGVLPDRFRNCHSFNVTFKHQCILFTKLSVYVVGTLTDSFLQHPQRIANIVRSVFLEVVRLQTP